MKSLQSACAKYFLKPADLVHNAELHIRPGISGCDSIYKARQIVH